MAGAVLLVLVVVVVLPSAFLVTGALVSALLGWALKEHAEAGHEGSEYVELNR